MLKSSSGGKSIGTSWNGRACCAKMRVARSEGGTEDSIRRVRRYSGSTTQLVDLRDKRGDRRGSDKAWIVYVYCDGAGDIDLNEADVPPQPFAFAINVCLAFSVSGSDMATGPNAVPTHSMQCCRVMLAAMEGQEQLVGTESIVDGPLQKDITSSSVWVHC